MSSALRFASFELRRTERMLLRDGRPLPLGTRAFDTLLTLVEAAGDLVTKESLLDRVWPGLHVEEANIHVQVSLLRKLLGPDAIATVPGVGYRIACEVVRDEFPIAVGLGCRESLQRFLESTLHETRFAATSWNLRQLSDADRRPLLAMAVCAAGCDLQTFGHLLGPDHRPPTEAGLLDDIARLAASSLVVVECIDGTTRCRLPEWVRPLALEQAGQQGDLRALCDRLLAHFVERTARWAEGMAGPFPAPALRQADLDIENALGALDWALSTTRWSQAVDLARHILPWWDARTGPALAPEALDAALAIVPADAADPRVAARLCQASSMAGRRPLPAKARDLAQRSATVAARAGDRAALLDARIAAAALDADGGLPGQAFEALQPVVDEARCQGWDRTMCDAWRVLARAHLALHDAPQARALLRGSLRISGRLGQPHAIALDGLALAFSALECGDAQDACHWMREAAPPRQAADHRGVDQRWIEACAWLAAVECDWPAAVRGFHLSERLARSLRQGDCGSSQPRRRRCLEAALAVMGDAAFEAAREEGTLMPLDVAMQETAERLSGPSRP